MPLVQLATGYLAQCVHLSCTCRSISRPRCGSCAGRHTVGSSGRILTRAVGVAPDTPARWVGGDSQAGLLEPCPLDCSRESAIDSPSWAISGALFDEMQGSRLTSWCLVGGLRLGPAIYRRIVISLCNGRSGGGSTITLSLGRPTLDPGLSSSWANTRTRRSCFSQASCSP